MSEGPVYTTSAPAFPTHTGTNPLVPLRQVFSVQLVKQEMCVHSQSWEQTLSLPFGEQNLLTTELHWRGGHCCLHFCSPSSFVNLIPHFSFVSGVMECFVLKSEQAEPLESLPENPQGNADEFISGRNCDELLSKYQFYHSFPLQVITRKRTLL